jgi:AraC-like DNA-binding protein
MSLKPEFEQTPMGDWESFHCEEIRGSSYNATWHFHPEVQLTLVLKSSGYRLVGDNISALHAGDLVLLGSNLPHVWHQEREPRSGQASVHAIVVRFLPTFLGPGFLDVPEMAAVRRLLTRASRGLHVTGETRNAAASKMKELPRLKGLQRLASLLCVLDLLAKSSSLRPIASPGFVPDTSGEGQFRLERILGYLHENLERPINRAGVARQAHMNPTAFSRFFRQRTGKTLPEYVNEVRIGRACRMLADEQLKVIDIAMRCGFQNLANFNRKFLQITGYNPSAYRTRLRGSVQAH